MAFNFSALKIDRGPTLARETGQVVQLFQSLQATTEDEALSRQERDDAQQKLETLYTRIQNRMEELEDFYVEHDTDQRAILFEKQRMDLRRVLHAYSTRQARSRADANRAAAAKSKGRAPAATSRPAEAGGSQASGRASRLTKSTRKKLDRSMAAAAKKEKPKPIYDWEKQSAGGGGGGAGEGGEGGGQAALDPFEQPMVTFDIVLTEKEFFTYTSRLREFSVRQRAKKAEIAHASRRRRMAEQKKYEMAQNTSLQASGPYLDPQRLSRSMRRSPQKSQWMDKKGLRPY